MPSSAEIVIIMSELWRTRLPADRVRGQNLCLGFQIFVFPSFSFPQEFKNKIVSRLKAKIPDDDEYRIVIIMVSI